MGGIRGSSETPETPEMLRLSPSVPSDSVSAHPLGHTIRDGGRLVDKLKALAVFFTSFLVGRELSHKKEYVNPEIIFFPPESFELGNLSLRDARSVVIEVLRRRGIDPSSVPEERILDLSIKIKKIYEKIARRREIVERIRKLNELYERESIRKSTFISLIKFHEEELLELELSDLEDLVDL